MGKRFGPFQIIGNEANSPDSPIPPPERRYACAHYETCLDLGAALNWENFTCSSCCGEINESLYWRAHQAMKKDKMVRLICDLPEIGETESETPDPPLLQVGGKR